jgi:signal transduction histidine kinase
MNLRASKTGKPPRLLPIVFAVVIVGAVGFVDYVTGYEVSFAVFYLLAISVALWCVGTAFAVALAVLSVAIWLLGDWAAGAKYQNPWAPVWNAAITLMFYLIVIALLSKIKSFQNTLDTRVRERTAALVDQMARKERLEREILDISEREQQKIGRDLHDTLCQHLTGTAIAGQVLGEKLAAESRPEVTDAAQIVGLIEEGIEMARGLARGLFPVAIETEGLISALRELAATNDGRNGISCRFEEKRPALIDDPFVAAHLYRIAQEAVRNAVRHSGARNIAISLAETDGAAKLTVRDDGKGVGNLSEEGKGMGLRIMRHRAGIIGATFDIASDARGTAVLCSMPLQSEPI